MIDLCESCKNWDICYLDRYDHKNGKCDKYICKPEKQTRSAIIKAHPPHSRTNITRAEPVNPCPNCQSLNIRKYGHVMVYGAPVRRYKCIDCDEKFIYKSDAPGDLSSIQIRQTLKDKLASMKKPGESFEDVVARSIEKS